MQNHLMINKSGEGEEKKVLQILFLSLFLFLIREKWGKSKKREKKKKREFVLWVRGITQLDLFFLYVEVST